jgi:hypothetical protein
MSFDTAVVVNFGTLFKALDAVVLLREAAKRFGGTPPPPPETRLEKTAPDATLVGQLETRLTNVVVAALKEAFARDHARLELERAQLEEQRRRAEEALRAEQRRQAADREVSRLRLLAATALIGWIGSVVVTVIRLETASGLSRGLTAGGWVLLLASLGAAFTAQGRISTNEPSGNVGDGGRAGLAALWLLIAGLALSALSLLL